jgi:hypothetical protein
MSVSRCNPSINLQVGSRNDSIFTQAQTPIALSGLTEGWIVSIADDEGPDAVFGKVYAFAMKIDQEKRVNEQ